jgi:hypothetical protein
VYNWIVANGHWLFSGAGITIILGVWAGFKAFARWGYTRWRERPRDDLTQLGMQLSYRQVRPRPFPTRLPAFLLRVLYKPDTVKSQVHIALRDNVPATVSLTSPVPYVELYFQVTNLSAIDLVLDRMLLDVWFGQPTFETAILHRYVIPAGDISDGLHARQNLADSEKAYVVAFENSRGMSGVVSIYITAYFESKLGRFSVRQTIQRATL